MNARGPCDCVELNVSPPTSSLRASQPCTAVTVTVVHALPLSKVDRRNPGMEAAESPVKPPVGDSFSPGQKPVPVYVAKVSQMVLI